MTNNADEILRLANTRLTHIQHDVFSALETFLHKPSQHTRMPLIDILEAYQIQHQAMEQLARRRKT